MTKYFPASEIIKEKGYEILKERASGISKVKAYYILDFMGFKPMTSNIKSISSNIKWEIFTNLDLMGLKSGIKYFPAFEISKENVYEVLRECLWNIKEESLQHCGFNGSETQDLYNKAFSSL